MKGTEGAGAAGAAAEKAAARGGAIGAAARFFARRYGLSEAGGRVFLRGAVWSALANLAGMAPALVLAMALADLARPLVAGEPYAVEPWRYLLAFLGAFLAVGVAQDGKYRATFCDIYEESGRKRLAIAERLRRLPLSFFGKRDLADLTTVIMSDAEASEHALSHALPQLWGMGGAVATAATALALCDWRMALACLWVVPAAFLAVVAGRRAQRSRGRAVSEEKLAAAEAIQELIECAPDIRACNRQEAEAERLRRRFARVEELQGRHELAASVALTSARSLLQLGIATTLLTGTALLAAGEISLGLFLLFALLSTRLYDPVTEALMNILEVFAVRASIERLAAIEDHPVAGGDAAFSPKGFDIAFRNVRFSYDEGGAGRPVLDGVSFTARQGQVTALVGPSGSGKTTASKLAARLWDAQEGTITLGGADVAGIDPEVLLESFSVVFQDVVLFNGTVRENIRLGRRGASDAEVEAAAEAAQCGDFLARLPRGIDTELAEGGAGLSGGERQRISIARALLKDAPVVLLDEATASLDPESETRVQRAIAALAKGKTVLVVAHRMRTVLHAHRIVVLDAGRVAEEGEPARLLAQNGPFARLCRLQGIAVGEEAVHGGAEKISSAAR